ncbi:MAG TPA: response regulator [Dehalococcoidales bacterium]|nr:response regulator [Dehalococcoidales bacterium]
MIENMVNRGRALLLEDEPIICRAAARALTAEGYDVDIAVNGLIAKDKIQKSSKYECLILDIVTPVMNGIQLYEYLEREHPELTDLVIFTTGDSLGLVTKSFLERINKPFLSKPYTPSELKSIVNQLLDRMDYLAI